MLTKVTQGDIIPICGNTDIKSRRYTNVWHYKFKRESTNLISG